jgi:cytochrome b subunit of formate dehydrogenase
LQITGVVLWKGARTFGRWPVAISYVLHDISAVIMLGGIFIHIYLSTIGEPGTFQAMIRGAVSEAWAWTFHPAMVQTGHRRRCGRGLRGSPSARPDGKKIEARQ